MLRLLDDGLFGGRLAAVMSSWGQELAGGGKQVISAGASKVHFSVARIGRGGPDESKIVGKGLLATTVWPLRKVHTERQLGTPLQIAADNF